MKLWRQRHKDHRLEKNEQHDNEPDVCYHNEEHIEGHLQSNIRPTSVLHMS